MPRAPMQYNQFQLELVREEVHLKFYHFLPVFRYYLLVKDPESADVECLFRVNGLSTFTLGFAQMACMAIGFSTEILKMDFFIIFGIIAQCVNLFMTMIYFFTGFPEIMKSSMKVEAFQYNARLDMQGEFTRYKQVAKQYALNFGTQLPDSDLFEFMPELPSLGESADPGVLPSPRLSETVGITEEQQILLKELKHFRFVVLRDINEIAHLKLNLAPFSTQQLFEWRSKLMAQQIVQYGELAGI